MTEKDLAREYRLQQWAKAIQDQKASGLTINQWCEAHHVGRHQFFYRQKAVRKAMKAELEVHLENSHPLSDEPVLYPVTAGSKNTEQDVTFAAVPATALPDKTTAALRIWHGNLVIDVSNDASDRILAVLREVILHAE